MESDPRQFEQEERHRAWVEGEGHLEFPVQLKTYLLPRQMRRIAKIVELVQGSVLEVGCSWGYITGMIDGTAGCDLNPENVGIAKALMRDKQFFVADALNLPMPDDAFDTILLAEILEHLAWEDVPYAIEEAKRVARKRVVITLPDGEHDTDDATNMKHAWLATPSRVDEMLIRFGQVSLAKEDDFIYIVAHAWSGESQPVVELPHASLYTEQE